MPKLTPDSNLPTLIKMILLGVSGAGKSSALIPLTIPGILPNWPGLELRVLDFDGKFEEVARAQLKARLDTARARRLNLTPITTEQYNAAFNNLDVLVCRENTRVLDEGKIKKVGVMGSAQAWQKALAQLKQWAPSMDASKVLIVDSLTHMSTQAISNYTQELSGKLNQKLTWKDFMAPQQEVAYALTYFGDISCHVIITGHQGPLEVTKKTGEYRELSNGTKEEVTEVVDSLMLPLAVGSAGRIAIPSQLNHMLIVDDTYQVNSTKTDRVLYTRPHAGVVTKTPFFALAEPTYTLDRGMVEYFKLGM